MNVSIVNLLVQNCDFVEKVMNKQKFDVLVAGEINPDLIVLGDVILEFGQVKKLVDNFKLNIGPSSVPFVYRLAWQMHSMKLLAEVVKAVTCWDYSIPELPDVGARRLNMMRSFNAREEVGRERDMLPEQIEISLRGGKSDGLFVTIEELEQNKGIYFKFAGWESKSGNPMLSRLKVLDLEWISSQK